MKPSFIFCPDMTHTFLRYAEETKVSNQKVLLLIDDNIKCSLAHLLMVEALRQPVATSLAKAASGRTMTTTNSIRFSSYRQLPHGLPERGSSVRFLFLHKTFHEMETIKLLNHLQQIHQGLFVIPAESWHGNGRCQDSALFFRQQSL